MEINPKTGLPYKSSQKQLEYARQYSEANRDEIRKKNRVYQRQYRLDNLAAHRERNAKWQAKNKDKHEAYYRNWEHKYPVRYMLTHARYRAKKKGMPFSITEKDVIIPETCPYTGAKLVLTRDGTYSNRPSLDRIDNDLGYVPGNVQVISQKANVTKSNLSVQELINFAKHILKLHLNLEV